MKETMMWATLTTRYDMLVVMIASVGLMLTGCGVESDSQQAGNATGHDSRPRGPQSALRDKHRPGTAEQKYHELVRDVRTVVKGETSVPGAVFAPQAQGPAHLDPNTGEIAWRAMVCRNPNCNGPLSDGQGHVFALPIPNTRVIGGELVLPPDQELMAFVKKDFRCTACGSSKFLSEYDPPDVAGRRAELVEELAAARKARASAKQTGTDALTNYRAPAAIMYELSTLPALYLVPE